MKLKGWIIFAVLTVAALGGMIWLSKGKQIDVSQHDTNAIITPSESNGDFGDMTIGNKNAKVTLIEYGDYQCPGCASANSEIKQLVEKYSDHMLFVFRNTPLSSIHPNARAAAAAALAASYQGKYWEMHNLLFEKQVDWSTASSSERTAKFESYASSLGLDVEKFTADLASEKIAQKINFDLAVAKEKGFTSTPTFTINSEKLEDASQLEAKVTEALKQVGVEL